MLNSVCLMGRLVKDPELRKTNDGKFVASFRLAHDQFVKADGTKETLWIDVSIFGQRAETVAKYMRKGMLVAVTGRLNQRKFVSSKTNTEMTVTEIIASAVDFAEPKKEENAPSDGVSVEAPTYVEKPVAQNTDKINVVDDDLPF